MRGLRDKADLNPGSSSILHLPEADNPSENLSKSGNCSLAQPEVKMWIFSLLLTLPSPSQAYEILHDLVWFAPPESCSWYRYIDFLASVKQANSELSGEYSHRSDLFPQQWLLSCPQQLPVFLPSHSLTPCAALVHVHTYTRTRVHIHALHQSM